MSETMFELSNSLQTFLELAGSGDVDDQQVFTDTLEAIKGEIGVKADSYKFVIDQLSAQADKCKEASAFLAEKGKRIQNNIDRMKEVIKGVVETVPADKNGKKYIQGNVYKFSIAKNGGRAPLVIDGEVPDNFHKITVDVDKAKIRKALDAGEQLSFAHYGDKGTHLNIK